MARLLHTAAPFTGNTFAIRYLCVALSLPLFLQACKEKADAAKTPRSQGNQPVIVDVIIASSRSVENTVEANGTVVANEYVELHPEISGRITYLNVPEGAQIEKGTVIARINDADLQATLEKSRVQLDLYQKTLERDQKLLDIQGINQADYDLALNNVNSTKADIAYTQAQIDKTIIRAPFSGIVGLRQVSPGAYVTPANVIATVQQLDRIKVDFTLPEQYAAVIRKGSLVDIEIDAASKAHRKGLIIATEPQINQTSRNLKVRAILQEGKGHPGAFVKVFVDAGADKQAVMVPTNCIIPEDKNNQLILVKQGRAQFVNVQTGVREANNVEITKGVSPGDTVVVTGVLFARPRSPLQVRSVKDLEKMDANQ
ncbi:efflux RND transporter periplasmic adaptor subunit [Flavitalea sp. BT771]|uniref:efflux RND transporter periplasmic adaptor subunit n=1 Tax=Flavitalea sp. BT771 TaxID=3063329 RepID=UPI0026E1E1D8|nr:efflux RND transporter periplasmic adaptor subunit [Flavitalea sp. BT771]MDO6434594.1 efflux RND transporter periplasmic adaptor subunit [Flavitalea sp. BT771]MDV6223494.1 efflux RND transporter periplasmic adaptor subunit [Flavitalea sp. BT771]